MNNIRKVIFILAVGFAHHTALYAQDKIVFPDISYAGTPRVCVCFSIDLCARFAKSALAMLIVCDGFVQIFFFKVWPLGVAEIEF